MNTTQRLLEMAPRTKLRLSEAIRLIRIHRIIVPTPTVNTIRALCEAGIIESAPRLRDNSPHYIFEDSFLKWVKTMDESPAKTNDKRPRRNKKEHSG